MTTPDLITEMYEAVAALRYVAGLVSADEGAIGGLSVILKDQCDRLERAVSYLEMEERVEDGG